MPKIAVILTVLFLFVSGVFAAEDAKAATKAPDEKKTAKKVIKKYPLDDWKKLVIPPEQLKKFNGKNGNPPYVAVDGIVYDVSAIPAWKGGEHKHGLKAGNDLTEEFAKAPPFHRTKKVMNKAVKIGVLEGGLLDPAVISEKEMIKEKK
ncbi:MAG: cytochrome b5 domain-containing protein [Elusimicrobiota bacterium]